MQFTDAGQLAGSIRGRCGNRLQRRASFADLFGAGAGFQTGDDLLLRFELRLRPVGSPAVTGTMPQQIVRRSIIDGILYQNIRVL